MGRDPVRSTSEAMSRSLRLRRWLALTSWAKASSEVTSWRAMRMPTAVPICRLEFSAVCRCRASRSLSRLRTASAANGARMAPVPVSMSSMTPGSQA